MSYELNKEIEQFVLSKDTPYTKEDMVYVNQYVGYGGMWNKEASLKKERGLYEYYTPIDLVEKMVGLAVKHGYKNGAVLEPSCGVGRFLHYFNPKIKVVGIEMDQVSCLIAKANFPSFEIRYQTFNELFTDRKGNSIPRNQSFDLVIGNPPYGSFSGKFTRTEKRITRANNYVEYFISRGLDMLNKGGLLIYVIPSSYLDGNTNVVKEAISKKGSLIDAYRLPVGIFSQTSIQTDIIVYKKQSNEAN